MSATYHTLTVAPRLRFFCSDGETHIATKIRKMENSINKTGGHWIGTREEFEQWAESSMMNLLRNLAQQVYVTPVETGKAVQG